MNILVLNGSPKGDNSVTMSSVKYLKVVFPEHDFQIKHVAQSLHRLEKDRGAFDELINDVRNSEVILWAFPLYFLLVHSNYKRFIELIFEREVQSAFHGKYTASFSTSIHFYDHTAHNYIRGICEDLEMHFVRSFSADMRDLMDKQERKNLENFAGDLIDSCKKQVKSPRSFPKLIQTELAYKPSNTAKQVDSGNLKLIVLTDTGSMTDNLRNMLHRFQSSFLKKPDIIDLSDIKINGGCLGCLN